MINMSHAVNMASDSIITNEEYNELIDDAHVHSRLVV